MREARRRLHNLEFLVRQHAHAERLHITLEEMLSPTLSCPGEGLRTNRLLERLGEGTTAALYDQFVFGATAAEGLTSTSQRVSRNALVHGGGPECALLAHGGTSPVGSVLI